MKVLSDTAINQFIVKLRLQAIIEGINEKAALGYAAARLRLATGEITEYEYHTLIDEINNIFNLSTTSKIEQTRSLNDWIEKQIYELKTTPSS
ncbi:MAG: photosystem I assembly protein [Crocosphaera sp.]|nr:photosystem I assembly protein [Crocosphaera sp.]